MMTMPDFKPLYRNSFKEAQRLSEVKQWRESQQENIRCRDFLDEQVGQNFDGMHLNGNIAEDAIAEFGFDRVNWVMANHVQYYDYDGRFSSQNKAWAKELYIPRPSKEELRSDQYLHDHTNDFLLQSHNVLADYLAERVRKLNSELNLLDVSHCEAGDVHAKDFQDKLLILKPDRLAESYRCPENQLFLADIGGFGCSPSASGRAVMGHFLIDGERMNFNRDDFLGIADYEQLPEWATEKLAEIQSSDTPNENNNISMKGM
jgi:hypothetical protein